jgi:hypothetical protein
VSGLKMNPVATLEEWEYITARAGSSDVYKYEAVGLFNADTELPVQSKVSAARVLERLYVKKRWDVRFLRLLPPIALRTGASSASSSSKAGIWYTFVPPDYLDLVDDSKELRFDLCEKSPNFAVYCVEAVARISDGQELPLLPEWEHEMLGVLTDGRIFMFDHSPQAPALIRDMKRRSFARRPKRARRR